MKFPPEEVELLQILHHSNICSLLDFFHDAEDVYMVMECEGTVMFGLRLTFS
jgi:serine/threonine protein kinase